MEVINLVQTADDDNPMELHREVWQYLTSELSTNGSIHGSEPPVLEWPPSDGSYEYAPEFGLTYPFDDTHVEVNVVALGDHFENAPGIREGVVGIGLKFGETARMLEDPTEPTHGLLSLSTELYGAFPDEVEYGYGLDPDHLTSTTREPPVDAHALAETRIDDVSWLMLFPPAYVEEYGREFLLDAPVWRAEELDDGAVMLVATENPADTRYKEYKPLYEYFELEPPV